MAIELLKGLKTSEPALSGYSRPGVGSNRSVKSLKRDMTMDSIDSAKVLTIRECGYDEYWLRDRIFDDPTQLGLGDLQAVMKERDSPKGDVWISS